MHPFATEPTSGLAGFVVQVMEVLREPGAGLLVAAENLFPPIPSEIILPLAGFAAYRGTLSLTAAILWTTAGSLVGALALYWLGHALGRRRIRALFDRLPLTDPSDMDRTERWFARHGYPAVLFGRLLPVIRSLVSVPAGTTGMKLLPFVAFTTLGSAVWNSLLILAGYELGRRWQLVEQYVSWLQYVVVGLLVLLAVRFVVRRLRRRRAGRAGDPPAPGTTSASAPQTPR